jgi:glutathione S-transferase
MSLALHFHPLSSFCHKVLIALYENGTPFEPRIVNLMDSSEAAAFKKLWPCGQFPVLQDGNRTIPESSIIIEHLDLQYPGKTRFIPADPKLALQVRLKDRFYDLHLHAHMQKVVGDRLRPEGTKDPNGVENARKRITVALDMIDAEMAGKTWAMGGDFTMADCAAGPPLFYIDKLFPFVGTHQNAARYLGRLLERPSYARAIEEAKPYFSMLPF